MDLPFDGGISRFYTDSAPADVQNAIKTAGKGAILNPDYPYPKRMKRADYETEMAALQIELVRLQTWARETGERIVVVFEGRDAAGKGGTISRMRANLGSKDMKMLFNINAEFAHSLDQRPIGLRAKSAVFSSLADAILVSGPITGQPADGSQLREAAEAIDGAVPVFANTGVSGKTAFTDASSSLSAASPVICPETSTASGRLEKLPEGPMIGPRPGPTLASAVPAPLVAVMKSNPSMPKVAANKQKITANRKKKLITESATESGMALPL